MGDVLYAYKHMENFLLNYMGKWFAVNGLSLNTGKTNALYFKSNHPQNDSFQIVYQGKEIKEVTNTTFLGLGLNKHMERKTDTELKIQKYEQCLLYNQI